MCSSAKPTYSPNHPPPDWILKILCALRPPKQLTVSEWADQNRILDQLTSAQSGTWRTDKTPYLREIMDCFNNPQVQEIVFVKPTQVGGTEALLNIMGYIIDQDQSPTMIVYPTEALAKYASKNRLRMMIQRCDCLKMRYHKRSSNLLELQFDGMYVSLNGANSPSALASKPIRFLLMDELDKYPPSAGKEADPVSLAMERTKTYPHNKKIFKTSTPTLDTGAIWQEWESCAIQKKYEVPCPHCGQYQELVFSQLKWSKEQSAESVRIHAKYHCLYCKKVIEDNEKSTMLLHGKWRNTKEATSVAARKVGYHLNALYSPWLKFGEVAYAYLQSAKYPELLMNFYNSWLAQPWKQIEITTSPHQLMQKKSGYTQGVVPDEVQYLTAGVDVQRKCMYWTIRGWGDGMTSWNIAHGQAFSWDEIDAVMNQTLHTQTGLERLVHLCAIDSGDQTDEVYEFCAYHREWAVPVKGSSVPISSRYTMSQIQKIGSANGMSLYVVDGSYYKDMIFSRIARQQDMSGGWFVTDDVDEEYCNQVTSEYKVLERRGSRSVAIWKTKSTHTDNHYLDCEVYAAAAADFINVRDLLEETSQHQPAVAEPQNNSNAEGWIGGEKWKI